MTDNKALDASYSVKKHLIELVHKTNRKSPDQEDVRALRAILRDHPDLWSYAGDLVDQAARRLFDDMIATPALKLSLQTGFDHLTDVLTQADDGHLERLIVQHLTLCWMRLAYVEYQHSAAAKEGTDAAMKYWEGRLNAAERRFLRTAETLTRIRRLRLPPLQVNVAQQQVNQVNVN